MSTQSDSVKSIYQAELGKAIDTIFATKAYTEIKAMYDNRQIEAEAFNLWLSDFTEKAFFTAEKFALAVAMIDPNKDAKSDKELELLEQKHAIQNERRVSEMTLLATEILAKQALYESEVQRKLLLTRQKVGFDDNTIIKYAQTANETIAMIQSGGNEAPAGLWTQQGTAMSRLDAIAHR